MEEFGSIPEVDKVDNENLQSGHRLTQFMQLSNSLQTWVRRTILFICYIPGVFGFFWLIGRILKR